MSNIYEAFREHRRKAGHASPSDAAAAPLLVETLPERQAALAKMRAKFPSLFALPERPEPENPYTTLDDLAEVSRATPIAASPRLIAQFKARPTGYRAPEDREDDPT